MLSPLLGPISGVAPPHTRIHPHKEGQQAYWPLPSNRLANPDDEGAEGLPRPYTSTLSLGQQSGKVSMGSRRQPLIEPWSSSVKPLASTIFKGIYRISDLLGSNSRQHTSSSILPQLVQLLEGGPMLCWVTAPPLLPLQPPMGSHVDGIHQHSTSPHPLLRGLQSPWSLPDKPKYALAIVQLQLLLLPVPVCSTPLVQ